MVADVDPRVGPHEIVPFQRARNATIDTLRWARKRLSIPLLLEVDVTDARHAIRAFRSRTGKGLSLTAWVVSCVARAAAEHPHVHAVRLGKRRLVVFHEVDVAVLVEHAVADGRSHETVPMPFVVRRANEKQPAAIHEERSSGRGRQRSRRARRRSGARHHRGCSPCSSGCPPGCGISSSGAGSSGAPPGSSGPWGLSWSRRSG